jgi:hypothetical protein
MIFCQVPTYFTCFNKEMLCQASRQSIKKYLVVGEMALAKITVW